MGSQAAAKRRKQKELEDRGPGIAIIRDGRTYQVFAKDLRPADIRDLRARVGLSFVGLLRNAQADMDIDLLAATEWLARRVNGEPNLDLADVEAEWSYDTKFDIPTNLETPAEPETEDGSPET